MSKTMETSQWVFFFAKAGLPQNVASNYALIFFENRIQVDMLLDLSKEYLYDMGIKVMGDVIAILKYAKEFHNQLAKQRLMYKPPAAPKPMAERVAGHYTRPAPAVPRPTPPTLVQRLPTQRSYPIPKPVYPTPRPKPKMISLKKPVAAPKMVRKVPPEEEGAYNIKMPLGTTEKTRKILQQQQRLARANRSVFARLGDSAVSSTTDSKVSSTIFERLGPTSRSDDIPTSTVRDSFKKTGRQLPYQGVMKMTVGKSRTVISTTTNRKNLTITRTVMKPNVKGATNMTLNQINSLLNQSSPNKSRTSRPISRSASSQGVMARMPIKQRLGIQGRLGNKIDVRNAAQQKVLLKTQMKGKGPSNVFARLGR